MTGTLVLDDWIDNEYPADEFTPRNTPGVF